MAGQGLTGWTPPGSPPVVFLEDHRETSMSPGSISHGSYKLSAKPDISIGGITSIRSGLTPLTQNTLAPNTVTPNPSCFLYEIIFCPVGLSFPQCLQSVCSTSICQKHLVHYPFHCRDCGKASSKATSLAVTGLTPPSACPLV